MLHSYRDRLDKFTYGCTIGAQTFHCELLLHLAARVSVATSKWRAPISTHLLQILRLLRVEWLRHVGQTDRFILLKIYSK